MLVASASARDARYGNVSRVKGIAHPKTRDSISAIMDEGSLGQRVAIVGEGNHVGSIMAAMWQAYEVARAL